MRNKKILFIAPNFFSIENVLIEELKNRGNVVFSFDERAIKNSFLKAINFICPYILYGIANNYYKKQICLVPKEIDFILVIKGEMITKKTISLIRAKWPHAKLVLYLYDSIKNVRGVLKNTKLYDRVFSFDSEDCKKYNFSFRPLFCDNQSILLNKFGEKRFDLFFYGTMYGDRFDILNKIVLACSKQNVLFYRFCYLAGKFMKLYYFLTNSGYRSFNKDYISTVPKSHSDLASFISSSYAILDINDVRQSGITIRTFEALFSGKRIITTNSRVAEYDFYDPNFILIIDRKNIDIPIGFFFKKDQKVEYKNLEKYTPKGWIDDVFYEI